MNSDATLPGISQGFPETGIFHLLGLGTTWPSYTNMVNLGLKNKQTSEQILMLSVKNAEFLGEVGN